MSDRLESELRGITVGNWLAAVLVLPSSVLDYFAYPDRFKEFLMLRAGITALAVFNLASLKLRQGTIKRPRIYIYDLLFPLMFCFGLMANLSGDGFRSGYLVAVIEVMFGMVLIPLPTRVYAVAMLAAALSYTLTLSFAFPVPAETRDLIKVPTVLGTTIVILTIANFFIETLRKRLKDANEKNEYFVKVFAHDMKNSLFAEQMTLSLASMKNPGNKEMETLAETNGRMARMVGNLINVFSEDKIALKKQKVSTSDVLQGLAREWAGKFAAAQIELRTDDGSTAAVDIDLEYMKLVWDNLLSNALQHTDAGGEMRVRCSAEGENVTIVFANTGEHLPEEFRGNMGTKFLDPKKHSPYSKGLGLHYSAMMCRLHGGSLEYHAADAGMNEFVVSLPAAR